MESSSKFNPTEFLDYWMGLEDDKRAEAWNDLSNTKKKAVNKVIAERKKLEAETAGLGDDEEELSMPEFTPGTTQNPPGTEVGGKGKGKERGIIREDITDAVLQEMWTAIDILDVSTIDAESLRIFEYVGFNPDEILRSLLLAKTLNNVPDGTFKRDVLLLCGLAIIKGSVNANNFKKMSKQGQDEVARLENLYGIKRGSGRQEESKIVTVSRVAAAFPGKIMQLLVNRKVNPRRFVGPCKSSTLPGQIRHQAFAAVVPLTLGDKTKEFLLGLATGFSVDQSITINPNKKIKLDHKETFSVQKNFIQIAHDSGFPRESVRIMIFKSLNLNYDHLIECAQAVKRIEEDFIIIDKSQFVSDLNAI